MRPLNIVIGIVATLALAGGGFAAGMTYERSQAPAASPVVSAGATGGRGGTGATRVFGGGGGPSGQQALIGRVVAVNDGSITIATVDRSQGQQAAGQASPVPTTQIVLVGANTRVVKTAETEVKLSEIKPNDQVTVVGSTDSAGMVAATAVVVGPTNILGQLFGSQTGSPGFGGRPAPSPTKAP